MTSSWCHSGILPLRRISFYAFAFLFFLLFLLHAISLTSDLRYVALSPEEEPGGGEIQSGKRRRKNEAEIKEILTEIRHLKIQLTAFQNVSFVFMKNISKSLGGNISTRQLQNTLQLQQQQLQQLQLQKQQQQLQKQPQQHQQAQTVTKPSASPSLDCVPKSEEDQEGFPYCAKKMEWMKAFWKSDKCYAEYGVDNDVCSQRLYLAHVENW